MGRKASFTEGQVFGAVAGLIGTGGTLGIQEISAASGVSVGSLYHRFGSREAMLAQCWLDAVRGFQTGFLAALERSGLEAALETPRFCRREPARARVLASPLAAELDGSHLGRPLARQLRRANRDIAAAIQVFAERQGVALLPCRLAIVEVPLTVVRLYLPRQMVPEEAETHVARAYRGLMDPG